LIQVHAKELARSLQSYNPQTPRRFSMFGILNLNKPAGPTSRDCVNAIERLARPFKVGHAGTLDPIASGVLLILVGQAVRLTDAIHTLPKEYVGKFQLGVSSESMDTESPLVEIENAPAIDQTEFENILPSFTGIIEQTPPKFSAIWVDGKRAHEMAREGKHFEIPKRQVKIDAIELIAFEYPFATLRIRCSTGTYIRSLGCDIAQTLGTDAVMVDLIRTSVGPFCIQSSHAHGSISTRDSLALSLSPASMGVEHWPRVCLSEDILLRLEQGKGVPISELATVAQLGDWNRASLLVVLDSQERLRGLIKQVETGICRFDKCFLLSQTEQDFATTQPLKPLS
jgi:tRNA pseudouridine55 synthase